MEAGHQILHETGLEIERAKSQARAQVLKAKAQAEVKSNELPQVMELGTTTKDITATLSTNQNITKFKELIAMRRKKVKGDIDCFVALVSGQDAENDTLLPPHATQKDMLKQLCSEASNINMTAWNFTILLYVWKYKTFEVQLERTSKTRLNAADFSFFKEVQARLSKSNVTIVDLLSKMVSSKNDPTLAMITTGDIYTRGYVLEKV